MKLKTEKLRFLMLLLLMSGLSSASVWAQRFAVKTNAISWATLSPNIGAEIILSNKVSLDLSATFNPFQFKDYRLHFVQLQPEVKYWFGRPLSQHYIGITGFFANNNLQFRNYFYKGDLFAGGLTYGYAWVLNERWTMEASFGVGAVHYRQFKREAAEKFTSEPNKTGTILAPVKLGLTFSYILK